ncbi:MAG TPA: AsmA-like C-terminal region-containing protein [Candidatus Acidoferrum sp.]
MKRWILIVLGVFVLVVAVGFTVIAMHWPFTQASVVTGLQQKFGSHVEFKSFRSSFFPPTCVAEGVTFRRNTDAGVTPIATAARITIEGSYPGFFTVPKRISHVTVEGLHVFASPASEKAGPAAPPAQSGDNTKIEIGDITADNSVVEFASGDAGARPLRFEIHKLTLNDAGDGQPMAFHVELTNPLPQGEIRAEGEFGPLDTKNPEEAPASGSYTFERANLGAFPGIGGTLYSTGKFDGKLNQLEVAGMTDVPDFNVSPNPHTVHLRTQFHAVVNGWNGDVSLKNVKVQMGSSTILARGEIASKEGTDGKTVSITGIEDNGSIKDWLELLAHNHHPKMTGTMKFRTIVYVPPGKQDFIKRMNLRGDFEIGQADFTKPATQEKVNNLSQIAQGQKPDGDAESVFENMRGHVEMENAVANVTDLYFGIPGALAHMHGTYGVENGKIDLHGNLRVDHKLSKGETGVKSVFLKVIEPMMKKKKAGEVVPVKITGTMREPSYGLDVLR